MVTSLTVEDLENLQPIVEKAYQEIYHGKMTFPLFMRYWTTLMKQEMGGILTVHDSQDLQGFLGYVHDTNVFKGENVLACVFIYILPEYRGRKAFSELLDALEGVSDDPIEIQPPGINPTAFLELRGYHHIGLIYRKDREDG